MEQPGFHKLAYADTCTGCAACASVCNNNAIEMYEDVEGFLFPQIDNEKCVDCGLCSKFCPVLTPDRNNNSNQPEVFALWYDDDREKSSSGGAFSAFARKVLANGGIVYGAAFDENLLLRHIKVTSLNELDSLRGSKYVQSSIEKELYRSIKTLLRNGTEVLFCGTPCQVVGLKKYLLKDYDNLLTLDLICHGVPSGKTFRNYIRKLASRVERRNVTGFQFRRLNRWGISPSVQLNGKFIKLFGVNNLYMSAFDRCAIFRKSCHICPYARIPRQGDCSLGDFWGIGRHGVPFNHDTKKGVSLVIINNEKGEKAINSLNGIFIEKRTMEEAVAENHNIMNVSIRHNSRDAVIEAFNGNGMSLEEINRKFKLVDKNIKGRVKQYADYLGVFDIVKQAYNWVKTL